jgi:hypothetical protein
MSGGVVCRVGDGTRGRAGIAGGIPTTFIEDLVYGCGVLIAALAAACSRFRTPAVVAAGCDKRSLSRLDVILLEQVEACASMVAVKDAGARF